MALDEVVRDLGERAASELLATLARALHEDHGVEAAGLETPYVNTIPADEEPSYPGDLELEARLEAAIRWNAMAMVVRANRAHPGLGGHISTYASAATLFEVALHHCIDAEDIVYFQGHASPGIYARAHLEGRLDDEQIDRFRREVGGAGLSSYPHPWLMPEFWTYPTVSMGLSPLMAIHQARLLRYLEQREIVARGDRRVWCFVGDGECDEPESLSSLSLAAREHLGHLIMVVNCNLQRLDGPVRGNEKIVQELERRFIGAGWQVLKVLWGRGWDPLFEADEGGLVARLGELVDGELQRAAAGGGKQLRELVFRGDLAELVADKSDGELEGLTRGGHDATKLHAAYARAMAESTRPTVILAQTVKGYGLGEAGEAAMITHQQKTLDNTQLRRVCERFELELELPEDDEQGPPLIRPSAEALDYLSERREALGGPVPRRRDRAEPLPAPSLASFEGLMKGSEGREVTTTAAFVRLLAQLLRSEPLGPRIVPIIPDEARTFGMEGLFRKHGIYAAEGQRYEPVDAGTLAAYHECADGQILEEGITEAGSMADFIAAGTAYASCGVDLVPFYTFYSMFGLQRVGDLVWAAGDARARGFLLGATAGRTTLNGEGLQHQDGHSQLFATAIPNLRAYDPAFAFELAIIVRDGLRRMLEEREPLLSYITLYNQPYAMPVAPDDRELERKVLAGIHRLRRGAGEGPRPHLLASGPLVMEALRAQVLLRERFDLFADVWSVTSWSELRREAAAVERRRRLDPELDERSTLEHVAQSIDGPVIAVSDYLRLVPEQLARWLPGPFWSLGTDGYGRSDTREQLRRFFEIDAEHIAYTTLRALHPAPEHAGWLIAARGELGIDASAPNPATA